MVSYGQDTFTLFLHVQSAQHLSTSANAAFCTTFVWSSSSPGSPAQSTSEPKYTNFSQIRDDQPIEWNEEVQLDTTNPQSEVLTVRVQDSSDKLVGSCNVYLAHLHPEQPLDQWFQLHPAGHIHLKLVLSPNQRPIPTPVVNSPYATDYQALLDVAMKKRAAAVNESPLPSNIAMLLELQNQAQQNTMLMINQQLRQQQQMTQNFMHQQAQSPFTAGYPSPYQQQQSSGHNFHQTMETAANISTIAANMQQLNGSNTGTSGLGTAASIGLGALGLGPFGTFFGS
ncbi:hypothetical protein F441_12511 [Phytophthora nicotianae CJ01A1]|uniref:Methyltransferase protein 13 n=3 Tax=Phytophthora nicotianae TaxID=4792 RepID=W2KUV5_PHYNI|nr:hypothetical protein L915_12274 [Phytophthora nicotianae]ETL88943.1 hypothetical protein L917_12026 [Phytophthora nicotianae]ETO70896.1 hypothetical protein F444_12643 [Phytophthora nicotianae P1976]ETP12029.1 hypothetical protein F441_12511 [Phytophthora nicotianae CJ01A1]KUF99336.1 Methyltransferase protein 13 [Phytophthora nicotianae]